MENSISGISLFSKKKRVRKTSSSEDSALSRKIIKVAKTNAKEQEINKEDENIPEVEEVDLEEEFKKVKPRPLANGVFPVEEMSFEELELSSWLANTCRILGMKSATDVQKCCIPEILHGKPVIGVAQTGSGKTAAFALPILQTLSKDPYGVYALALTPTRELAYQIGHQFNALSLGITLRQSVIVGGLSLHKQSLGLSRRPHLVIATPGRLACIFESDTEISSIFRRMKYLILDEADQLLDVKYQNDLKIILSHLPIQRQTLLFSATMTPNLINLQSKALPNAFVYQAYQGMRTVSTLRQEYVFIPKVVKDIYLWYLVHNLESKSAIIFCNSIKTCKTLSYMLEGLGQQLASMHGGMKQKDRFSNLEKFKSKWVPVLVATDVAGRGLDIPAVDLVINYEIPEMPEIYVHRVGRTARAGRSGSAISFVTQFDVARLQEIEKFIDVKMSEYFMDESKVLNGMTAVYASKKTAIMKIKKEEFEKNRADNLNKN